MADRSHPSMSLGWGDVNMVEETDGRHWYQLFWHLLSGHWEPERHRTPVGQVCQPASRVIHNPVG